ncbi:MAG: A/G-specific adenine glycosylase [Candidatus Azotimanducaceae bacterium]|jgi:A/G-specific adenine glycosylase
MALAFRLPATILDGNVKRVLARCYAVDGWPGQTQVSNKLWAIAEELSPDARIADYTQAIMDIGATLCTRSKPKCEICPFSSECIAYRDDRIKELPGKKPKKAMPIRSTQMLVVSNPDGELLLQRRPSQGLWGGLWSFPECDEQGVQLRLEGLQILEKQISKIEHQTPFRHTFTHFHLDITPVHVELHSSQHIIGESDKTLWYRSETSKDIGLTGPVTKILKLRKSA